jgi:hypothetical protein
MSLLYYYLSVTSVARKITKIFMNCRCTVFCLGFTLAQKCKHTTNPNYSCFDKQLFILQGFYAEKLNNVIVSVLTSKYEVDSSDFNSLGIILPGHTQYCTIENASVILHAVQYDQKQN